MPKNNLSERLKKDLSKRLELLIERKKDEDYHNSIPKQVENIGIPYQTFIKYKNAEIECPASNIVKIAEYYNVSTDYLLGVSDVPTTDTKLKAVCEYVNLSQEAVERLQKLPPHCSAVLDSFIKEPLFYSMLESAHNYKYYLSQLKGYEQIANSDIDLAFDPYENLNGSNQMIDLYLFRAQKDLTKIIENIAEKGGENNG